MNRFKQAVMKWGAAAVALVVPAFASATFSNPPGFQSVAPPVTSVNQLVGASGLLCVIINWIFWLLIILTIIFVLVAAFGYLTAGGDPEKVSKAGQRLLYAAVAVVVALLAKAVPYIVATFFGSNIGTGGIYC